MITLLSWLGRRDLDAMVLEKAASVATLALKGPMVDSITILVSAWEDEAYKFEEWLKKKLACAGRYNTAVKIQRVSLVSPIDYASITKVMQKQLSKISLESETVYLNLTSGTPAMAVVSVLLGNSIAKCQLLQTSPNSDIIEVSVPVDFATEYKKAATGALQDLTTDIPKLNAAFDTITSKSEVMKQIVSKAQKLALSDLPALILGESGTGKEVMATAIHKASVRADKSIRAVNCGALPENLVDSILFGHVKGAFTGADKGHLGLFEQSNGGTLFLDEVGELPLTVQVKLLRALQQREITRVGDTKSREIDVRVIAATHRNLLEMTSEGTFREDLFYRLAVGVIEIPPLRSRPEDIPELVSSLLNDINQQAKRHPLFESKTISNDAILFAQTYQWPGNIRELWNTLNRAVLWSDAKTLSLSDLQSAVLCTLKSGPTRTGFTVPGDIQQYVENIKKDAVTSALEYSRGNKSEAAKALGLNSHQNLNNWIKKLGLEQE